MKKTTFGLLLAVLPILAFSQATFPDAVKGLWLSENGKQKIEIYKGSDNKYYGKVIYMAEDDPAKGTSLYDSKNPNPNLRNRRVTGINMLYNFTYSGNRVFHGIIYDPSSGSEYKCKVVLSENGRVARIRGYIGLPIFGRTEVCTKIR